MTGRSFGHRKWGKGSNADRDRVVTPPSRFTTPMISQTQRDREIREEWVKGEEGNLSSKWWRSVESLGHLVSVGAEVAPCYIWGERA